MKILVTGSNGFIGSQVVKELGKRHQVKGFDLAQGNDLLNQAKVRQAVKGMDAVVHLAALLDEGAGKKKLFEVNVQGTKNLLEACVQAKTKKVVYLSTVGVMGSINLQADELNCLKPKTNYEKSKAEAEEIANSYGKKLAVIVLRSALVLGPNQYWKKIIKLVKKGFPLIGGGKNLFQVVYYKDLVSGIMFALEGLPEKSNLFIVAEEKGKTLREIYELIQRELGIKEKIKSMPLWLGKLLVFFYSLLGKKSIVSPAHVNRLVRERNYSIKKFRAVGWEPRYGTEEGIRETVRELL